MQLLAGFDAAGQPLLRKPSRPITLRDLLDTGDTVVSVEGIFSGTLAWLFNKFDGSVPFSQLVMQAREVGYTEPDPRDDLSGTDVARKLAWLGICSAVAGAAMFQWYLNTLPETAALVLANRLYAKQNMPICWRQWTDTIISSDNRQL